MSWSAEVTAIGEAVYSKLTRALAGYADRADIDLIEERAAADVAAIVATRPGAVITLKTFGHRAADGTGNAALEVRVRADQRRTVA